jgi:hypothetical protein
MTEKVITEEMAETMEGIRGPTKLCVRCQCPFRPVPLMNDNTCGTCERLNSMTFWFPILLRAGIPVPKTIFIHADNQSELAVLLDGNEPDPKSRFFLELELAAEKVGLPAFLRTEMLSDKHGWKETCYLESADPARLIYHVASLVEASEMANIATGTDHHFWAVREFLQAESDFTYFHGDMPITKEIRVFVRNGEIECFHPYWPKDIFPDIDPEKVNRVRRLDKVELSGAIGLAGFIAKRISGYWSIDLLKTKLNIEGRGFWYCTDMAIGERSYHDPECKYAPKDSR